jgi:hypothetical protein
MKTGYNYIVADVSLNDVQLPTEGMSFVIDTKAWTIEINNSPTSLAGSRKLLKVKVYSF